jgi:hypothetical protein
MRNVIIGAAAVALWGGWASQAPASHLEAPLAEVAVQTCTRVEAKDLGALPLEVEVGGKTVRFAEWTLADELSTDLVGFAAQVPEGVTFTVEAGDRRFTGAASRWLHPLGVSGPGVHGIDGLTFCAPAQPAAVASAR